MLIVGQKEVDENKVSVRSCTKGDLGVVSTEEFIKNLLEEIESKK